MNVERLRKIRLSRRTVPGFRRALYRWYRRNGRDLPWRRTKDPYAILVSELMLQQTQVSTVIPYYHAWLRRFPDFAAVARADESDVLREWQGLGYYARARNFHATAKIIQHDHRGKFPIDSGMARKLPGVGQYIGNAVATFAFDQSVPIVEANTGRVLARVFDVRGLIDSSQGRAQLWAHATQLIPRRKAAQFNSALIDLGAMVCLPRTPRCPICPVRKFCRTPHPELLPKKRLRPRTRHLVENHALILRQERVLLQQSAARWRRMWILPPVPADAFPTSSVRAPIHVSHFPFTHHQIELRVFKRLPSRKPEESQRWFTRKALNAIPIPSPHRRAINALLNCALDVPR